MRSVWAPVRLSSTSPQMTRLLTPYWTHVREGQRRRRRTLTTPALTYPRIGRRAWPAPPGSPRQTPACRDCSSGRTSPPSPSPWRRHRRMSRCWWSRVSPSRSCRVTFTNTNQSEGRPVTQSYQRQTRSDNDLFSSVHWTVEVYRTTGNTMDLPYTVLRFWAGFCGHKIQSGW